MNRNDLRAAVRGQLYDLGFTANDPDEDDDEPIVGSSVLTPEEAGTLLPFVRDAFAHDVPVTLGPGDEPDYLTLTFDFS